MSSHTLTGFHRPYFIASWVEFGVSILFLCARCLTAFFILHSLKADLYLACLTFTFGAASMAMITAAAAEGLGVPEIYLSGDMGSYALLYGWLNQFLALIAIGLGKLAIVAFLQQIQGYKTTLRSAFLWFLAGSNFIVNFIAAVLAIVQCSPVEKLWHEDIPGTCSPGQRRIQIFGYIQGTWSAFCDFCLALFPVFLFVRVQAFSKLTRFGLCVLMGSGVAAGACAIVKTIQLERLTTLTDATYQLGNVIVWNQSEMWVVFIVSCIPPTKVFFARLITRGTHGVSSIFTSFRTSIRSAPPSPPGLADG